MKIRLAQINPIVGNLDYNSTLIKKIINTSNEFDIVVFPELSLTGYPPQDLLLNANFISKCQNYLDDIKNLIGNQIVIIGFPRNQDGCLFNSAAILKEGEVSGFRDKVLLPSYDVFDEKRYFTPSDNIRPIKIEVGGKNLSLGIQICEDLWDEGYSLKVTDTLIDKGAEMIVNISASPYRINILDKRIKLCKDKSNHLKYYFIYCNLVGAQDELVYDGQSFIIGSDGKMKALGKMFEEDIIDFNTEDKKAQEFFYNFNESEEIYKALCLGVRDYFKKSNLKKAVIGLSGGIDSSLTAAIATHSLGNENVIGVSMPSKYSSDHSKSDAQELAENLGIKFETIPINPIYDQIIQQMKPFFEGTSSGLAEENLQARIRGNILMSISNKIGALVLNTGNKTELALGYCTMYGDMCGALGVISDLNKLQVYSVSRWINSSSHSLIIPESVLQKRPSAELKENQYDPFDYSLVSPIVDHIINDNKSVKALEDMGYPIDLVNEILDYIHRSEYKRRQAPPGIKVSEKAFGVGRRYPIANQYKGNL